MFGPVAVDRRGGCARGWTPESRPSGLQPAREFSRTDGRSCSTSPSNPGSRLGSPYRRTVIRILRN